MTIDFSRLKLGQPLRLRPLLFTLFAMTTVLGAIVAALIVVNLAGEQVFLEREREAALANRDIMLTNMRREGLHRLIVSLDLRMLNGAPGELYGLFAADGRHLHGNLLALPAGLAHGAWQQVDGLTADGPVELYATATRLPGGFTLVVGRDLAGKQNFEHALRDGAIVALVIVIAASLAVGFTLSALVARRASSVAEVAERIAEGEFGARAEVSERGDSFDRIGAALNAMLDRVEELMTGMRTVTDSLAHDLRTPLTRMRGMLEEALDPMCGEEERRSAIIDTCAELERLQALLSAMMDIARAESGLSREMMQKVRLDALATDVAGLFAPVIEDAGQEFVIGRIDPAMVDAHEPLLRQALGNMLYNAALHAGTGARVVLEVRGGKGTVEIEVADNGPGIPEHHRGRVQERFVRLDSARTSAGSGLGLSIVAAAAKLHGGTLLLEDNRPGLRAILSLDAH